MTATHGEGDRMAVAFAHVLRGTGLDVPVGSVVGFAQALGALGVRRQSPVYWAGRATLVSRPEDVAAYDRAFAAFWLGERPPPTERPEVVPLTLLTDDAGDDELAPPEAATEPPGPTVTVRYSPTEVLRHKDFADCSPSELAEARRLMTDLRLRTALRRSRRMQPARRARGRGGGDPLGRMGSRRPAGAGGRDGQAGAGGAPRGLGQPAQGLAGVRPAGPGHGRGVAVR